MNENNKPTEARTFFEDHAPEDLKRKWPDRGGEDPDPTARELVRTNRRLAESLAELAQRYRRFMLLYGAFAEKMSKAVNVLDKHSKILSSVLPSGVMSSVTKHVQEAQAINRKLQKAAKNPDVLEDVEGRDPWGK